MLTDAAIVLTNGVKMGSLGAADRLGTSGKLHIQLFDDSGNLKDERFVPNVVCTAGKTWMASSLLKTTSNTPAAMTHMAVGSDATTPTAADTVLTVETARVALTSSTSSTNVVTYVCTFGTGVGTGNVQEAGILNASSAGTLLCHSTFTLINKGSTDTLTITWTVTLN